MTRRLPGVGERVTIVFLAAQIGAVVEEFDEARREVVVVSDEGEQLCFALNRATGRFHLGGDPAAARLVFGEHPAGN